MGCVARVWLWMDGRKEGFGGNKDSSMEI